MSISYESLSDIKDRCGSFIRQHGLHEDSSESGEELGEDRGSTPSIRSPCSFHLERRQSCCGLDYDSEPDRSNPAWKLSATSVRSPWPRRDTVTVKPQQSSVKKLTLWDEIMREYEDERTHLQRIRDQYKPYEPTLPEGQRCSAVTYLETNIFPILCPALQDTLFKAKEWECLKIQKCRFSGLDYLAELIWNRNPLHPRRKILYRTIFEAPFAKISMYYHPRPIYPLSWLWSEEEAITVLQTYIRRYLVCREKNCHEMREFWKSLKQEDEERLRLRRVRSIELTHKMVHKILDEMFVKVMHQIEEKLYGCHCPNEAPCQCECSCKKWCRCCKCYKSESGEVHPGGKKRGTADPNGWWDQMWNKK